MARKEYIDMPAMSFDDKNMQALYDEIREMTLNEDSKIFESYENGTCVSVDWRSTEAHNFSALAYTDDIAAFVDRHEEALDMLLQQMGVQELSLDTAERVETQCEAGITWAIDEAYQELERRTGDGDQGAA